MKIVLDNTHMRIYNFRCDLLNEYANFEKLYCQNCINPKTIFINCNCYPYCLKLLNMSLQAFLTISN